MTFRIGKRALVGGLAAAGMLLASSAAMSAESWRFAHKMPADSPEGIVFQKFADLVKEYTNGDINVKMFPNEQLGKTAATIEQLQRGTVHIYAEGSTYMQKYVQEVQWISAPFAFDNREHWVRFMNSDMVKGWFAEAAEKSGIMVLGDPTAIVRGPYRVMVANKDIRKFEDMKGLKLRMAPNKTAIETWTRIGSDVKTLAWTDVYQAIDKGIVSAVNSPIALVESMRFYEVAPYVIRHDEYYQSIAFMVNVEAYNALSDSQRAAIDKAYVEAGKFSEELMGKAAEESIVRMKKKGVSFVDIDTAPFVELLQAMYKEKAASGDLPADFLPTVAATRK
jgi:tripartite ATP-independent transporter DctP family solute receptor